MGIYVGYEPSPLSEKTLKAIDLRTDMVRSLQVRADAGAVWEVTVTYSLTDRQIDAVSRLLNEADA